MGAYGTATYRMCSPGTTVLVSRLFQNVPARQKFLRGARSEWRAISEAVTTIALERRDIRLSLEHDGRRVHTLPPASSLRARVAALWGNHYAERFVDADDVQGATHTCPGTPRAYQLLRTDPDGQGSVAAGDSGGA